MKNLVIDDAQSSPTLSGISLGITMQQQAAGSLSPTCSGTIDAGVTETSVVFVGGSTTTANNSGNWQPGLGGIAGNAPAKRLRAKSTNNNLTAATIVVAGEELVLIIPVDHTLVLTGNFDATFRVQA